MTQKLIIVSPPGCGAEILAKVLTLDSNWQVSREIDLNSVDDAAITQELIESDLVILSVKSELSLQISEITKKYPPARFIHLTRLPAEAIKSALLGWRSKNFVTHPDLPGWWGDKWSYPLVDNWQDLIGLPLPEVVSNQWFTISDQISFDLSKLTQDRWINISFEELMLETESTIEKLTDHFGLVWQGQLTKLPIALALDGVSSPKQFNRLASEVTEALNKVPSRVERYLETQRSDVGAELIEQYKYAVLAELKDETDVADVSIPSTDTPFSYQHSESFLQLLQVFKSSLAVSTYNSGHLILVRPDQESKKLNCAFTEFNKPMGIAVAGNRFALGTMDSLLTYTNHAALSKLIPSDRAHDAIYFPRASVHTGDISIHEMAYGSFNGESPLWFINTRFSCLCTLSLDYSFEPVWRPEWITELAAEDRCHLNGLAMVSGKPKYVSALAKTNEVNGWRKHKGTSGLIVDIDTNEIVVDGLSMPHSPRWYQDSLWILESGKGSLAKVNPYSGDVNTIATLPGFTRGLAFIDKYAFVGLSQVRESVFSELPVTKTKDERNCGIWVVDITSGEIVAILKFDGVVQEIFDVALIPGASWPKLVTNTALTQSAYVLSEKALQQVKENHNQTVPTEKSHGSS